MNTDNLPDTSPPGYEIQKTNHGYQVRGPGLIQTWKTYEDCLDAAKDHHKDGTIVSIHDMEEEDQ